MKYNIIRVNKNLLGVRSLEFNIRQNYRNTYIPPSKPIVLKKFFKKLNMVFFS